MLDSSRTFCFCCRYETGRWMQYQSAVLVFISLIKHFFDNRCTGVIRLLLVLRQTMSLVMSTQGSLRFLETNGCGYEAFAILKNVGVLVSLTVIRFDIKQRSVENVPKLSIGAYVRYSYYSSTSGK